MPAIHSRLIDPEISKHKRIAEICDFLKKCERDLRSIEIQKLPGYINGLENIEQAHLAIILANDLWDTFNFVDDETRQILQLCYKLTHLSSDDRIVMTREKLTRSGATVMRPKYIKHFYFMIIGSGIREKWDVFSTRRELLYLIKKFWSFSEHWSRVERDVNWFRYSARMIKAAEDIHSWKDVQDDPKERKEAECQTAKLSGKSTLEIISCMRWLIELRKPVYELEAFLIKYQLESAFPISEMDKVIPTGDVEAFDEMKTIFSNYYRNYTREDDN